MNKDRRQEISDVLNYIVSFTSSLEQLFDQEFAVSFEHGKSRTVKTETANIVQHLERIKEDIEDIKNAEEEYKDNLPENLQSSERAGQSENAISSLEDAYSAIEETLEWFTNEEADSKLQEAIDALGGIE